MLKIVLKHVVHFLLSQSFYNIPIHQFCLKQAPCSRSLQQYVETIAAPQFRGIMDATARPSSSHSVGPARLTIGVEYDSIAESDMQSLPGCQIRQRHLRQVLILRLREASMEIERSTIVFSQ
jgi:hypothetical protein